MPEVTIKRLAVELPSDLEIRMTREFRAPKQALFDAHTKPEYLSRWWGRTGSTLSVCEIDARPGGKWRFVERQADGSEYGFHGDIREVLPPDSITWTFEFEGMPGHVAVETVSFSERDGITTLTTVSRFASKEDRDGMLQSGMEDGANESMDRLEAVLAGED